MIRINYKAYEKISVIFMGLTYFCLLFRVDLGFENFLASVFSIIAAISCRTYYTMENRILYKKNPQTKEIKEKIDKNIGMSYIAHIIIGGPAIIFFILGVSKTCG